MAFQLRIETKHSVNRKLPIINKSEVNTKYVPLCIIDSVSKTWCVYNGQLQLNTLLLDVNRVFDDLHGLTDAL